MKESLGEEYDGSLANAATWADQVRRRRGYTWSGPLHYMDAHGEKAVEVMIPSLIDDR